MEEDRSNHYQSFDQLLPDLKKLKSDTSIIESKCFAQLTKILYLVIAALLINSLIIAVYLYFNPDQLSTLLNLWGL